MYPNQIEHVSCRGLSSESTLVGHEKTFELRGVHRHPLHDRHVVFGLCIDLILGSG